MYNFILGYYVGTNIILFRILIIMSLNISGTTVTAGIFLGICIVFLIDPHVSWIISIMSIGEIIFVR